MYGGENVRNLTEGSMLTHIINFSYPMFLGNLLQTLNTTMDGIWVGRFLGPEAIGAIAVTFPITFLLVSLVMGLSMATTILVSQYAGAKDPKQIEKTIYNSLLLLIVAGVFVAVTGILVNKTVLALMNTPAEILPAASQYFVIVLFGLIFMFGYNGVSAVLRGLGDAKTPLLFLTVAVFFNIALDPFLILGLGFFPKMGVNGAALATVLSHFLAFLAALVFMAKKPGLMKLKIRSMKLDREITVKTLKIGVPTGVQATVISMSGMILASIINSFGAYAVAAYGIATNLDKLAIMIAMSIAAATTTITAQNFGAGNEKNMRETLKWSWVLAITLGSVFSLIALLAPAAFIGLFTSDENVLLIGKQYLSIAALSYIPLAVGYVTNGALRGVGDAFPTMFFTIIALWGVRVPLAKLLSVQIGVNGIWLAILLSAIMGMLLSVAYYASGRWKKQKLAGNMQAR